MTRFMLPLTQAVDLVLFALKNANPGDIFVRKAPSARVDTLAEVLQKIFGRNVDVQNIGIRHGEKIHESLASAEELSRAEEIDDYFRISMDERDINYEKYFSHGCNNLDGVDYTSGNTKILNNAELEALLRELPEINQELKDM